MADKETFMKNYAAGGGIYDPEKYYEYHQECERIERDWKDATYNQAYNNQMVRQLKQQSFNRHLRR